MPRPLNEILTLEKAYIFRITHRDNIPFLLEHGAHCRNSKVVDPNFVEIGNPEIIDRRKARKVPVRPGGTLADYVPFYFTPCTPMLYNIVTGWNGVRQRSRSEIAILATSLTRLEQDQLKYVVADRNATLLNATIKGGRDLLLELPWENWRGSDFRHDPNDPAKAERYQAETLVHGQLPASALRSIIVYDAATQLTIGKAVDTAGLDISVRIRSDWYL